jgi:hypothetical protein
MVFPNRDRQDALFTSRDQRERFTTRDAAERLDFYEARPSGSAWFLLAFMRRDREGVRVFCLLL